MIILDIIIRNSVNKPIYEQIYDQIKAGIISGELEEGELLPSIRGLAKDLKISVMTTKRAYDELERDGFIYTMASKGSYVQRKDMNLIREEYLKRVEEKLREAADIAPMADLSQSELLEIFKIILEEE